MYVCTTPLVQVSALHEELEKARERIAQLEEGRGDQPGTYIHTVGVCVWSQP